MSKLIFVVLIQILLSCKVFAASFHSPNTDSVIVNDASFIKLGTYSK